MAQQSQLRAYTLEDGLPQSQVYDMVQDTIGYLWLGTQGGGLCRFDGEDFKIYREKEGLLSNYVHALYETNDSLFIGTRKGLSVKIKNNFHNISGPQINAIARFDTGIYLATQEGIFKYVEGALKKMGMHPKMKSHTINAMVFDGKQYWIATNKGLWNTTSLESGPEDWKPYERNDFKDIAYDGKTIFAATYNDGILVIDPAKKEEDILIKEPLRINNLNIHNKDEVWVSTDNNGLTIVDSNNYTEKYKINRNVRLNTLHIRKTMEDRHGNVWIATSGGGIYKYFQNNFKHYDQDAGLKGNQVYAIHAVNDVLWISNSEAGLVKVDSLGIHHVSTLPHASGVKIKTITSDGKGNIWAGTDGRGILYRKTVEVDSMVINSIDQNNIQIDTIRTNIIKNYHIDTDKGLFSDWISKLHVENDTVWAASYSSGIIKFVYDTGKDSLAVLRKFDRNNGLDDPYIRDMQKDTKGRLWYATKNGHLGYIQRSKIMDLGKVLGPGMGIGTILFNKDRIYLGTSGSGIWWSEMADPLDFRKLSSSKYSYSNSIYQLIFDDQGSLWAGTERGVDNILLDGENTILDIFHYGRNDGFLGIETCLNAVAKDNQENLWFGTLYGLTQYLGQGKTKRSQPPRLYFEMVEVGNTPVDSINYSTWTNSDKVLSLAPEQKQLSFEYASVDIDHPNAIQYRFKLNEDDWSSWSNVNRQNFSGLAYGAHIFSAQARNYRWEESDPIRFQFFIDRPLYQKPWFQWMMWVFAVLLLGLIGLSYIRKVQQKNKEDRERLQMENHLLSLEQKALRLQMNPHFIFNVLNGIKAMGASNTTKMNTTINSFAALLRETLYNSRKDSIGLDQEIKALRHYIEVEQLMAPVSFDYDIKMNSSFDPEEVLIPPMLIQPFVENAIRHGILKGNRAGKLNVEFSTDTSFLYVVVTDNGIGIYESQKKKNKTDHQSMALQVTRERLESISGKDALIIKELQHEGTISGTQIRFKIPLQTDY